MATTRARRADPDRVNVMMFDHERRKSVRVVIIGAGQLAKAAADALGRRGIATTLLSRSSGFDVLVDRRPSELGTADAVIEATDITTQNAARAKEFFTRSTRATSAAARAAGARHILVSIVD